MNLTKLNRTLHSPSAPDRVGYTAKAAKLEEISNSMLGGR